MSAIILDAQLRVYPCCELESPGVTATGSVDRLAIQVQELDAILRTYYFDLQRIPHPLIDRVLENPDAVRTINAKKIDSYPNWEKRVASLKSAFQSAKIKLPKIRAESETARDSQLQVSPIKPPLVTPERRTIFAAEREQLRNSVVIPPPSVRAARFPFLEADHSPIARVKKSARIHISEFANTSVTRGAIFYEDSRFVANLETKLHGMTPASKDLRDRCGYHLGCRLEMLYLLAVACWRKKKFEETELCVGRTIFQIGTGGSAIMQAAHSALLNVNIALTKDLLFTLLKSRDFPDSIASDETLQQIAREYGFDAEILRTLTKKTVISSLKPQDERLDRCSVPLVPPESDFGQNLSATVNLPSYCNLFDEEMEKALRSFALDLLNQCFAGRKTPKEVYLHFLENLRKFLLKSLEEKQRLIRSEAALKNLRLAIDDLMSERVENCVKFFVLAFSQAIQAGVIIDSQLMKVIDSILSDTVKCAWEEIYEKIEGARALFTTEFQNLVKIDSAHTLVVCSNVRDLLAKMVGPELSDLIDFSMPPSVSNAREGAVPGYRWIHSGLMNTIRARKILFFSSQLGEPKIAARLRNCLSSLELDVCIRMPSDPLVVEQQINLIELYLKLLEDCPNQLQIMTTAAVDSEPPVVRSELTEAQLLQIQAKLVQPKHKIALVDQPLFAAPATYLHQLIYYVVERVVDTEAHPRGLKITLDKPQYGESSSFKERFPLHLATKYPSGIFLKIGDRIQGFLWI